MKYYFIITLSMILLSACSSMPQTVWELDDGADKPAYAKGAAGAGHADSRVPLDVPPELRQELEVPMPDQVAVESGAVAGSKIDSVHRKAVAGKAVSLHQRQYDVAAAQLFSAVVDAMTALNLPVDSVDSPSGTLTTEWVRRDANSVNVYADAAMGLFGGGPTHTRYRYVVRVLRVSDQRSQLEIRTLGQQFINKHWVNKPLKINLTKDLFAAVEERLPHAKKKPAPSVQPVSSETVPSVQK